MRLEVLITKYLDGELTAVEDKELRQLLSHNPEAKGAFDLSVSLHHALRKDAHLSVPPPHLVRETEERVLMSILSSPEPRKQKKEKRFLSLFSTGSALLTGLVAVLLPLFTSQIGYEVMPSYRLAESAGLSAEMSSRSPQELLAQGETDRVAQPHRPARRNRKPVTNRQRTAGMVSVSASGEQNGGAPPVQPNTDDMALSAFAAQSANETNLSNTNETAIASLGDAASTISSGPASLAIRLGGPSTSTLQNSVFPEDMFSTVSFGDRVHLTSTFGHDFLDEAGGNSGGLSFFSQSLAYSMSENENAGIELGYLWFTYGKPVVRFIPASTRTPDGRGENEDPFGYDRKAMYHSIQGQNDASLEPDLGQPDGEYVTEMQVLPKQTWWGAAFYERTLYERDRISLQGRVGAGGSNDGALAYIRAVGLYRVFTNLSLSVGFDARGMMLRTPYVTPKSHSVKTSFSFVYGFQLHL